MGLVLELQQQALDKKETVSDLLRKAYVIGRKLGLDGITNWAQQEISGFSCSTDKIPSYRQGRAELKAYNAFNGGWWPVETDDQFLQEKFSQMTASPFTQSMGEIEELLNSQSLVFRAPLDAGAQRAMETLNSMIGVVALEHNRLFLVEIREAVRNLVVKWTCDLEAEGILGEGMSFNKEERERAGAMGDTYHIGNQTIVAGGMDNSQIQQGDRNSATTPGNKLI